MTETKDGGPALLTRDHIRSEFKKGGGPVYPSHMTWQWENGMPTETESHLGITLRDYFAAAALTTELFDPRDLGPIVGTEKFSTEAQRIAECAYGLADAMIKARESRAALTLLDEARHGK